MFDYAPWALRAVRPVLWTAPALAGLVALWAVIDHQDTVPYAWAIAATALLTLGGGLFYDRSVLKRDGAGD